MSKFTVAVNGNIIHTTRGMKDAYCTAGETRDARRGTAPVGTSITVTKDGVLTQRSDLVDFPSAYGQPAYRDWKSINVE